MQKRLVSNGSKRCLVGESVTIADIDSAHIAFTYLLNEECRFSKLHSEVINNEEFAILLAYYKTLRDDVFKEYYQQRPKSMTY